MTHDPAISSRCAGCSTAGSGSTATRCTCTCCTHPTSSATRTSSPWHGSPRGRRARAGPEEGRQRLHGADRRPGDPSGQRAASVASTRCRPAASSRRLAEQLRRALDDALATVDWVAGFDFPDLTVDHELLALTGRAVRHRGGTIRPQRRTGLPGRAVQRARRRVPGAALDRAARHAGRPPATSPVRWPGTASTTVGSPRWPAGGSRRPGWAPNAATRSAASWSAPSKWSTPSRRRCASSTTTSGPSRPHVEVAPRPGVGHGWSEAPRGLLYHRYEIDESGRIAAARSSRRRRRTRPRSRPTCQGGGRRPVDLDDAALTSMCERAIRNYDPCISCATHFLTLTVTRR